MSPLSVLRSGSLLAGILLSFCQLPGVVPEALTSVEADRIVAEEAARLEAEKEARQPHYTVLREYGSGVGKDRLIIREVLPPVFPVVNPPEPDPEKLLLLWDQWERRATLEARTLTLWVRVFDKTYTEIIWRDQGEEFVVWSNVSFEHLQTFTQIEEGETAYTLLSFVSATTREAEIRRLDKAYEMGSELNLRDIPYAEAFEGTDPEYVIFADEQTEVPEALFADMDALHRFYLQSEDELKAKKQRARELADARKRYQEANPEEEGPTEVNIWYTQRSQIGEEK